MRVDSRPAMILVVEDEILISEMIADAFTERGFDVQTVANAAEAVVRLSFDPQIDILFTDVNLGGMDGAALAEQARELRPDLPVIYASGRWSLLEALRDIPRTAILRKPFTLTRACEAAEALLDMAPLIAERDDVTTAPSIEERGA